MSEEKRKFTRIPFKVSAEITGHDFSYKAEEILNLGIGGCLVPVKADLKPGTECDFKIIMSGTASKLNIRIKGTIVRCDAVVVAIKFTGIDTDSLFHLRNIIRYNSPDPNAVEQEILDHPGIV